MFVLLVAIIAGSAALGVNGLPLGENIINFKGANNYCLDWPGLEINTKKPSFWLLTRRYRKRSVKAQ